MQDSRGYIWIATDNGLSKFDGYEFRNYGLEDGLEDLVIFHMEEDQEGNIWVGGLKNRIYIYDPLEDIFSEYIFNEIINQHIKNTLQYLKFFNIVNDTLCLGLNDSGLLKIAEDGSFSFDEFCDPLTHFLVTSGKDSWLIRNSLNDQKVVPIGKVHIMEEGVKCEDTRRLFLAEANEEQRINFYGTKIDSNYIVFLGGQLFLIDGNGANYICESPKINHIEKISSGQNIVLFHHSGGAVIYDDLDFKNGKSILEDVSTTFFLEDDEGGYWVGTLESCMIS